MKISKIEIKDLYGIKEYSAGGESVELKGENGAGKTSVIDAIRYALTNKSDRDYIIRNGETEGEILIETDNGLRINRKPRTAQADYKSVKKDGREVGSPESFLKDIFTPLQLSPTEFMQMGKNEQNAMILNMIEYDWSLNWIKEQFGEIVPDINYEQNILEVLNDIQSEKGYYYRTRQDINRDIRNKKAMVEEIGEEIPTGYTPKKWEDANLGEVYTKIERIRKENEAINNAKSLMENRNNKVRGFEAEKEIATASLEKETAYRANEIEKEIIRLQNQIETLGTEKEGLELKKIDKLKLIEQEFKANTAKYDSEVEENKELAEKEVGGTADLMAEAKEIEEMKAHLNEYRRMASLQSEIETLAADTELLTEKIEKARTLPGEILETATIPIKDLTVKNGIPLINGLPISNLSEGEKLDLCIDVTVQNPKALKIILIDGVEKLSTKNIDRLYEKCKKEGLQFIATRTTDDEDLTVVQF